MVIFWIDSILSNLEALFWTRLVKCNCLMIICLPIHWASLFFLLYWVLASLATLNYELKRIFFFFTITLLEHFAKNFIGRLLGNLVLTCECIQERTTNGISLKSVSGTFHLKKIVRLEYNYISSKEAEGHPKVLPMLNGE